MATAFYSSYKPQILSRQEGFHLPSPAPSTPPSDGPPSSATNNNSANSNSAFDTSSLFISPPSYLSVPETFRKFPSASNEQQGHLDFSDELASLMSHPTHNNSHERSTQSPVSVSGYDDYQRPTTHNIFDISAPASHHHHSSSHSSSHHVPPSPHSPYPPASSAFTLPSASTTAHGLHTPGSSLQTPTHPLHEFTSHFNSTVPAIGSSMRYEPPSSSHGHSSTGPSSHPFALNVNTSGSSAVNNNNLNSPSASSAAGNEPSSFSSHGFSDSFAAHLHGTRQTPSPVLPSSSTTGARDYSRRGDDFSRSRSRSRSTAQPPPDPPSTNGGPARTARTTRPKRGSVSSVSPPPLHRGLTQPLVIPSASPAPSTNGGPRSPLSLHTSGWFGGAGSLGGMNGLNGYGINSIGTLQGMGEFSLPTPDSVHGHSLFGSVTQGSPKELGLSGSLGNSGLSLGSTAKADSPTDELAAKQAQIANEKRRRRRESHNAVERRRRDNINEKISELATLIPECLLDPNCESSIVGDMPVSVVNESSGGVATMTMPSTLSTSEDLLLSAGGASAAAASSNGAASPETTKKEEPMDDKDGDGSGVVKANKGMILRKSVEYIRYLQQLVSAQATRNRELEQQLHVFRGDSSNGVDISGSSEDDTLVLHEEIDGFNLDGLSSSDNSSSRVAGRRRASASVSRKKFGGSELESVAEMEQDTENQQDDQDMERPSTAGTSGSPLSGSGSDDVEGEEEEERGRKGRDGRPMGFGGPVNLKVEDDMETC
ncbi:helix-loop-helix DNA-binding domain-containing protein [Irpex rosettiformis]|uniref:Helix-loop-helix DNA-binding domain-containing protein n=1 Tax=Irpex rosettiformis TaxID=378272 RepID=A0ACB8U419_9APHY|nr:helix-loop-helix DNA-binding domain-containing protein [Irpex rosettiformis]